MRVTLENITKTFGAVIALDQITLTIGEGELLTLVGPSGCGKTTLLRLIAGLDQPSAGEMFFDGKSVRQQPPEERRVGLVFQNYALFPHMNVFDNVAYGLKFTGERRDRKLRVSELLQLVGLAGFEKRMPSELSAGQQQRAALARALAPRPRILLLDEPLSALDAKLRERLRVEIRRIQRALGLMTVYVTHDQEEALAISDRVAVLHEGRLHQVDTPLKTYHEPKTPFVARFIGRGNLIEARVLDTKGALLRLQLGDGQELSLLNRLARLVHPGDGVFLLVRPERIALSETKEIRLQGHWHGAEFLGDAWLGHIGCGGQEWLIKLKPDLSALPDGSPVEFGFALTDCLLL
jgi:thiamine transport system ATP-binding protein